MGRVVGRITKPVEGACTKMFQASKLEQGETYLL